ncbi:hypothetical protein WAI453_002247 [Rhynchosporium graminicola]|uniref:Tautomerase cis-CaaD-like domain-containing protein n=1 Tax=Rhynchosporium graminicola TaxID=2792576 RepID=A0A1E1LC58_9HELO|nr:uncharacterized protein RCO7_09553 [Rhynchosporium commune]
MPFYEVQHAFPLTASQRSSLAKDLTTLHATSFNAPTIFVNVKFTPNAADEGYFVGGEHQPTTNRIFVHVRSGKGRGDEAFAKLAKDVEDVWDRAVGREEGEAAAGNSKVLHAVFILPGITAREQGMAIPLAGEEATWLKSSRVMFEKRADAGEEDFKNLVKELQTRPELMK